MFYYEKNVKKKKKKKWRDDVRIGYVRLEILADRALVSLNEAK